MRKEIIINDDFSSLEGYVQADDEVIAKLLFKRVNKDIISPKKKLYNVYCLNPFLAVEKFQFR